jgi:hypothetical protein
MAKTKAKASNDVRKFAAKGRYGDTEAAHVQKGEMVVPMSVWMSDPGLAQHAASAIAATGNDPRRFIVGHPANSKNPKTGAPLKIAAKSVPKFTAGAGLKAAVAGKKPAAKELEAAFGKVSAKMDDNAKKLQRRLDNAKKSWEAKDASKAMGEIRGNFKDGLVGYDAQNETIRIYHEVVDAARAQVDALKAEGSADSVKALKAMKGTFKDTEVEKLIDEALKSGK